MRLIVIIWLLILAMIGGAMLYGRSQSVLSELQTLGFDVCNGSPCWRKVIPGITNWDEIKRIMTQTGLKVETLAFLSTQASNSEISADLGDGERVEVIRAISLNRQGKPAISLGEVIALYGEPCRVIEGNVTGEYQFQFSSWVIAYSTVNGDGFSPNTVVHMLTLMKQKQVSNGPYTLICDPKGATAVPWWGFASLQYYRTKGYSDWWK